MKAIAHLLYLPWLARVPSKRGWTTVFVWVLLAINISKSVPGLPRGQQLGLALLAFAIAAIWTVVPNVLWLARDMDSLRLPGGRSESDACVLLYLAISVLAPTLVFGALFGHALTWLMSLALIAAAACAMAVLPIGVTLAALAIVIAIYFAGILHPPMPGDAHFVAWAATLAFLLALVCWQRWCVLQREQLPPASRWWRAGGQGLRVARMNALRSGGYPEMIRYPESAQAKVRSVQLSRLLGPGHPVRSVRLALDPLASPNAQRVLHWTAVVGVIMVLALAGLLARHGFSVRTRTDIARQLILLGALLLSGVIGQATTPKIAAHWSDSRGALPLLAFLPHLGDLAAAKRATVLASLKVPAVTAACMLCVGWLVAVALHMPVMIYPLFLLIAVSGVALAGAFNTHAMAGHPTGAAARWIPVGAIIVLVVVTAELWQLQFPISTNDPRTPSEGVLTLIIFAVWAAWLMLLLVFAWRGWRLLQQRPHAFLASAPK